MEKPDSEQSPVNATRQIRVSEDLYKFVRARAQKDGRKLHRALEEILAEAMGGQRPWQEQG